MGSGVAIRAPIGYNARGDTTTMDAVRVHATLSEDGEIRVTGLPFKKGQHVELILLAEPRERAHPRRRTAKHLLRSPLVGLWENRDDIGDSSAFARRLRQQAQHRERP